MRAPLVVIYAAAVFHAIFVASRDDEDLEVEISTKAQDVVCEADCSLYDRMPVTSVSPDKKDDNKRRDKTYPSRGKQRSRAKPKPKSKPNEKSKNSTRGAKRTGRRLIPVLPVVRISDEGDLYESEGLNAGYFDTWTGTDENDYEDDTNNHESVNYAFRGGLRSILGKLVDGLESKSSEDGPDVSNSSRSVEEDRCQKWVNNWEKIAGAFPGSVDNLPACPCLYPNDIFYNNQIWDRKRKRKFRWRDVSHDKDRLAIYKFGAAYCVQTLPSHKSGNAIAQHCCYDQTRKLLTRGSGAGTPYIVSPDISPLLHDKVDLLPWRLCKGDFTRYNEMRKPNNGNDCEINPNDEEYEYQVQSAKNY